MSFIQMWSVGARASWARAVLASKRNLTAGPSTVQLQAAFLALFPSVAFQGALDLWQHNFVLSVFAPCFSFPVPL